jgi:ABC-type transport system involved in multi-copper enzyme maturation permease subunit
MAAITAAQAASGVGPARGPRAGLAGALRSEFTKLRSVRSTYWSLALLVLAGTAWSVANCAGVAAHWAQAPPGQRGFFDATQDSVVGLALLGQLVVVVLGTLAITSEYSTGMIRTSLTVLPRRGVVFTAKALVLTVVTLVIAMVTSFAAFFIGQYLLRSTHEAATLGQPDVLRAVLASGLYVALSGLFSFGLGAMLRSTAGALTAAYGLLFLVPQLAKALPSQWYADLVRWLPGGEVTNSITNTQRQLPQHLFTAWGEFAVFGGYTAIVLVAGVLLLHFRDA